MMKFSYDLYESEEDKKPFDIEYFFEDVFEFIYNGIVKIFKVIGFILKFILKFILSYFVLDYIICNSFILVCSIWTIIGIIILVNLFKNK